MENLPQEPIYIHYSCQNFDVGRAVYVIGICYKDRTRIWSADNPDDEARAIRGFVDYISERPTEVFIHWNMNKPEFSIDHILDRYKELTGETLYVLNEWINLANILWEAYGEFAPHPRLQNICELNNIRLRGYHSDPENYNTLRAKELAVSSKVAAIEKLYCSYLRGTLRHAGVKMPIKSVYITNEGIDYLYGKLAPYVDDIELSTLKQLLKGELITAKIQVNTNVKRLCSFFKQACNTEKITSGKRVVNQWLCRSFNCLDNNRLPVELSPKTVTEYLKGAGTELV